MWRLNRKSNSSAALATSGVIGVIVVVEGEHLGSD